MDSPFVYCGHPPSMRLDGYSLLETLSYGCFLIGPKSHSPTCLSAVFKSFTYSYGATLFQSLSVIPLVRF